MAHLLSIVALYLLSVSQSVFAEPCIAFDSNWNLYAFGLNGKDYNASTKHTWTSSTPATDITLTGRPPFNGANTTCYLAQYFNAIYVMSADAANPTSIYIYNVDKPSWSVQATTPGGFDFVNSKAILDHDTNVFYALSKEEAYFLDMGSLTTAKKTAIPWTNAQRSPFPANYEPIMALAQNHIHFLGVPGIAAGSAEIFVIHYSFFQPKPQAYPLPNGSAIPATQGRVASFFQKSGVQQEFAFIPQDSSHTYVINVETNTTQQLAGPATKDPVATYFASVDSLVQLASDGAVSFLPYTQGNKAANSAAAWAPVAALAH